MRMTKLLGRTTKETPKDAELPSHQLLLRGGYIRRFSSGIYGLLPLAKRSVQKIETIVREEMNRVEGQEVSMPCLGTEELWSESGRYQAIGPDMMRLNDRHNQQMLLCMTHEEPAVHLARSDVSSYKQLPFMIYQIQSKFRDEKRPRGGLIRLREFTMKDGYSFHTSEEDLKEYYTRVHDAYSRIFKRIGFKKFIDVQSDNGIFGGNYSHEFMSVTPSGEDTLFLCSKCDYKANKEVATCFAEAHIQATATPLALVATPGIKTIVELSEFLKISESETIKAVMFETLEKQPRLIACFIRGDLDVLQIKVEVAVKQPVQPAQTATIAGAGAVPGSTGPIGLDLKKATVILDGTASGHASGAVGANKPDSHYKDFVMERDFLSSLTAEDRAAIICTDIRAAKDQDPCPSCKAPLAVTRGIEIGNIFHLGTKYSASMKFSYLDENGKQKIPIMGCYGIGITRCLAAIIEDSHDENGIVFPMPVAPFQVHLAALNYNKPEVKEAADKLYQDFLAAGVEVIMDDRNMASGFQFKDADLMGMPIRVVISPKTLEKGSVECQFRDRRAEREDLAINVAVETIKQRISDELAAFRV